MTFNPQSLLDCRALFMAHTDLSAVELGISGDDGHITSGTSYHLGKSALRSDAYSRTSARDKAGLTEAASAFDIGSFTIKVGGLTFNLRHLTAWLFDKFRQRHPLTRDIREIIGTVDGAHVVTVDQEISWGMLPVASDAALTHLSHTHVSRYRDAQNSSSFLELFTLYFTEIGVIDMALTDEDVAKIWAYGVSQPAQTYNATREPVADADGAVKLPALTATTASAVSATLDHAVAAQSLTRGAVVKLNALTSAVASLTAKVDALTVKVGQLESGGVDADVLAGKLANELASRLVD